MRLLASLFQRFDRRFGPVFTTKEEQVRVRDTPEGYMRVVYVQRRILTPDWGFYAAMAFMVILVLDFVGLLVANALFPRNILVIIVPLSVLIAVLLPFIPWWRIKARRKYRKP